MNTADRVLELIGEIRKEKQARGEFPLLVLSIDLSRKLNGMTQSDIEALAGQLQERGLIRIGRTINYEYYEIIGS